MSPAREGSFAPPDTGPVWRSLQTTRPVPPRAMASESVLNHPTPAGQTSGACAEPPRDVFRQAAKLSKNLERGRQHFHGHRRMAFHLTIKVQWFVAF